jgi:hypothetical protein
MMRMMLYEAAQSMLVRSTKCEDRQASRDEKGDRGAGAPAGRDHASHLG